MIPFLLYIVKLSCCLTLFYVGYKLLLSHETFFHFNRSILLTGLLACMLFPVIKIKTETAGIIQQPMIQLERIMIEDDYSRTLVINNETGNASRLVGKQLPSFSFVELLALILITGCFINSCLLIRSHISLYLLIRNGKKIKRNDYTVVLFDNPVTPFNYGHYIILSEEDFKAYPETILTHELAHYHFLHSLDIALVELLTLIQWFNPVIRLLKKEIQKVHEFQADAEVLKTGIDTTTYQLLLVRKTVDSGSYTFANSFNHSKLKNRFTMMTKKKSNSWARLKLLLLLPVVAFIVYAFARPDVTRQLKQMIRSEDTTNPIYTPEFFEVELNKFISEQGGSTSLSLADKYHFLAEKTNFVNLFVNAVDQILLDNCDYSTLERLPSDLTQKLVAEYSNKKPALIYLLIDQGASATARTEIFNIVGKIFEEKEELFKQKNQPVLLLFGIPRNNGISATISGTPSETYPVYIAFIDKEGKKIRSFALENKDPVIGSFALEHARFINEITEWLKSPKGGKHFYSIELNVHSDIPMGVITDIKDVLRKYYALKIELASY